MNTAAKEALENLEDDESEEEEEEEEMVGEEGAESNGSAALLSTEDVDPSLIPPQLSSNPHFPDGNCFEHSDCKKTTGFETAAGRKQETIGGLL